MPCPAPPAHQLGQLHRLLLAWQPLKAQMQSEIAAAASDDEAADIRAAFEQRERALEHEIDHRPLDLHMKLGVSYNFLSK